MRNKHEELVESLHELGEWIEKRQNVHCISVPRAAALTIQKLEEENHQLRLLLNKNEFGLNRIIGKVRLVIYLLRKKWKKI